MTSKRPTLKTISELSGFAVPTVSRALKDAPDIGEATKQTVRRIATEVGYVPNRAGVRLRTGKTNVISIVLSSELDALDDHSGRIINSVAQVLRGTPYHMTVTPYLEGEDRLAPIRYIVETRSADAVIFAQVEHEDRRVDYLLDRHFPFATLGRSGRCEEHPYFDFDNVEFGRQAVRRLLGRGRRNLLLVAPPFSQSYSRHMIAGAREAVTGTEARLAVTDEITSHDQREIISAALVRHLQADATIDGIIVPATTAAIASTMAIERLGRRLGETIDIYSKEPSPFLRMFRAPIMAVHEEPLIAGRFLAEAAIRAIEQPELPPMQAVECAREPFAP
ncbi:LacI family DNA-binding transcriptional regulator [Tropicimonas sp. TH_r6]|uniref:LacI family DNA-binding transcriptional regulator n=1 Tax=Tropicimonas sp. TH_r6 TaxID=3082085 RepID=UPI0029555C5A|nr:LacI family DNA-binding transcriptional regulator [Tropicimonas sp. TH_r6]MDV7142169.1 LacI family DNA-binding transcriptional regulator [Tropicimonas sp. TH_r6]